MTDVFSPRFVWWVQSFGTAELWYVLDTQAPGSDPGQAIEIATCRTQEAAVMLCMTLNGQAAQ